MPLEYHDSVLTPEILAYQGGQEAKIVLNSNFTLLKSEIQRKADGHDDAFSYLFGEGILSVPDVTYSDASLGITFSEFAVLIGTVVNCQGGTISGLPNQTNAYIYVGQDGRLYNTVPTEQSYAIVARYSSSTTGITSFSLVNNIVIPKLVSITNTISNIAVPEIGYVDLFIDHSLSAVFSIPGFIELKVSDPSKFFVNLLYPGLISKTSDTETSNTEGVTESSFWVRITRRSGVYYEGSETCSLTYTRTGICIPT